MIQNPNAMFYLLVCLLVVWLGMWKKVNTEDGIRIHNKYGYENR